MTLTYQFGRFELRPATRQLLVDQLPAALGARAFDLLLALIERRDRLVTKDELLDLVWPGLVVEENNLQVQVSALRKLLGQDAIATVAGHGYRFTLEPTQADAPQPSPLAVAKHNLPAPVSSFVGRERDLIDLRAMLAHHRLVTLTGVGGHRQDAPGAATRRRRVGRVRRRCLVRGPRAGVRSAPRCQCGRLGARGPGRARPAGQRDVAAVCRWPGAHARARQLRASAACVRATGAGPPACRTADDDPRDEPRAAPCAGRGHVFPCRRCPRPILATISLPTR